MELPVATPDRLPGWDVYYAFWSISHWHPLVNGYSGYYPLDYLQTLVAHANVSRRCVDRAASEPTTCGTSSCTARSSSRSRTRRLMLRMAVRPEFRSWGTYKDPVGNADLFVLEPSAR